MGLIREPLDVDFTVIPCELSEEDLKRIRERILEDKEIRKNNPSIFLYENYPNGDPSEDDLRFMSNELERLRIELKNKKLINKLTVTAQRKSPIPIAKPLLKK